MQVARALFELANRVGSRLVLAPILCVTIWRSNRVEAVTPAMLSIMDLLPPRLNDFLKCLFIRYKLNRLT